MKTIAALLALGMLASPTEAKIRSYPGVTFFPDDSLVMGIDKDDLMQNNPSHWRKAWPEGDTDNGNGDAEVLEMFLKKKKAAPKSKITYPWNYDEDVIETKKSLDTAEGLTGAKLSHEAVKDGGLGMIFTYDNTKVQNRRGYVHGPHEWAKMQAADADYKL